MLYVEAGRWGEVELYPPLCEVPLKSTTVFLILCFIAARFLAQPQEQPFDANANLKTGPEVGQTIPAFSAMDQTGRIQNFDSLKGPKGLVLFFNRSVDW